MTCAADEECGFPCDGSCALSSNSGVIPVENPIYLHNG